MRDEFHFILLETARRCWQFDICNASRAKKLMALTFGCLGTLVEGCAIYSANLDLTTIRVRLLSELDAWFGSQLIDR